VSAGHRGEPKGDVLRHARPARPVFGWTGTAAFFARGRTPCSGPRDLSADGSLDRSDSRFRPSLPRRRASCTELWAMGTSLHISLLVCALAGCRSSMQVGLANAPVLVGATPDARVHDVIANGQDACERSAFPPGGVLRGQLPPCGSSESVAKAPALPWTPAAPRAWISPFYYSPGACPSAGPGRTRGEMGFASISLSSSGGLVCGELW
jgi:hypothetical protein